MDFAVGIADEDEALIGAVDGESLKIVASYFVGKFVAKDSLDSCDIFFNEFAPNISSFVCVKSAFRNI